MKFRIALIGLVVSLLLWASCEREQYASQPSNVLTFSADTISFDTIFTDKGSIAQWFQIKNEQDGIIKIDRIYLSEGKSSQFYINVNGVQGPEIKNIDIAAGDSIMVFVQTKLNEQKVDTALYHEDFLIVEYNSIQSKVVFTAWGQDVINYKGTALQTTTFTADKPYVIYDSLIVNVGETLTVESGAKIYMHYGANIIVRGTLKMKGTGEKPIFISSDRLEDTYQLLPSQWGSIIFEPTSTNNEVSFAIIKNGVNGLVFQGDPDNLIQCDINNTQISNMSGYGVYAQNAHIDSYNCVWVNTEYNVLRIQGGWFNSVHNTIYNEGTPQGRKYYPSVYITDDDTTASPIQQAYFYNTIIIGTMANEISMAAKNGDNSLPCLIKNCLLRDTYTKSDSAYYKENLFYDSEKKLFASNTTFRLDTLSQAMNIGNLEYANLHPVDLLNHSRTEDGKPDVGAMEYYYETKQE